MRVSFLSLIVIIGTLALASVAILIGLQVARRRRDLALREHGKPMLVMPGHAGREVPRPSLPVGREIVPVRRSPLTALAVAERVVPDAYAVVAGAGDDPRATTSGAVPRRAVPAADLVVGQSVRFHIPAGASDAPLRGALEVAEGPDAGLTIPFMHLAGEEVPTVTFGRGEGPPFRHVQVLEPTVSRSHARMTFADDGWSIVNLSRTNPVLVNGMALDDEAPHRLASGDRIEVGSVTFRYRWA